MISMSNVKSVLCNGVFVVFFFFFKTIYKKTIIRFAFCDIGNNQRLGKCYQLWALARLITLTSTLKIPDISKSHPIIAYKLINIV